MVTPDLLNYVRAARKRGMSDAEITQNLLQVGWDEVSAQESLYSDKPQQPMQQMPPQPMQQPVQQMPPQAVQQMPPAAASAAPPNSKGASMYADATLAAAAARVSTKQEQHTVGEVIPFKAASSTFWTRGIFWASIAGALLLIGVAGGAFAYYALPNIFSNASAGISKKAATTTPLFPVAASSTPTGKVSTPTSAGSTSCRANDIDCFIAAARTCTPMTIELNAPPITMFGLTYGGKGLFTLAHTNTPTLCRYSERTESIQVTISPEGLQKLKAEGVTPTQVKSRLAIVNAKAQKEVGMTVTCTMSTAQIVSILTKTKNGEVSSSEFPPSKCTNSHSSVSATGKSTTIYSTGEMTPETVNGMGVGLYSHEDTTLNGLEFKVLSLTASKLSVLITDHNTGKSSTEDFIPGQVKTVAGRSMTLKSIALIEDGTENGKPSYALQAKLLYHPYILK